MKSAEIMQTKIRSSFHWHPYLGHPSISQKKYAIKSMQFSISMRKTESPLEKNFFVTFGTCEKIEVKRGHLVKKWEFGQTKKILIYQFFKTRICAFMTYGQFPPKSSSNLRSVIRDSRVWGLREGEAEDLTFWPSGLFWPKFSRKSRWLQKKFFRKMIPFFS